MKWTYTSWNHVLAQCPWLSKSSMLRICCIATAVLEISLLTVSPALAAGADFDLSKAVVAGSLCPVDTGKLKVEDDKLIASFTQSRLALKAGEPALTALAACKVVLPLSVPKGQFISRITHRVLADIDKGENSEAKLIVATGYNTIAPVQGEGTFPSGTARSGPYLLYKSIDTSAIPEWVSDMCSPSRVADGILSTTLAVSAVRQNSGQGVSFDLNGAENGLEIWIQFEACR